MSKVHIPPELFTPARANHPDKPERGEDEDLVEYLGRCNDQWTLHPPAAPEGFELVECTAEPRHWPVYTPVDDDLYPMPCPSCMYDALSKDRSRLDCKANHRRWKSWRIVGWLASKGYSLGVIASCGTTYGRCEHCGIGVQHRRPRWRGKRNYYLGVSRQQWSCLRRGHRFAESHWSRGLCTICLPCPDCGSKAPEHFSCEATS